MWDTVFGSIRRDGLVFECVERVECAGAIRAAIVEVLPARLLMSFFPSKDPRPVLLRIKLLYESAGATAH
jgi:hypothetical protein